MQSGRGHLFYIWRNGRRVNANDVGTLQTGVVGPITSSMEAVVDGDSHFMEPLDLFERHVEPRFRERAVRIAEDPITHKRAMVVDGKPMRLRDVDEVLGILSGYGQKEEGGNISTFDRYAVYSADCRTWPRARAFSTPRESAAKSSIRVSASSGRARSAIRSWPTRSVAHTTAGPSIWSQVIASGCFPRRIFRFANPRSRSRSCSAWRSSDAAPPSSPRCRSRARASAIRSTMRYGRRRRTWTSRSRCTWSRIITTWAASFIAIRNPG